MRRRHGGVPGGIASWQREDGDVTELNAPNVEPTGLTPGVDVAVENLRR